MKCCKHSYNVRKLGLIGLFYPQNQKQNDALDLEEELRVNFQQLENEKTKTGRKNSFMKSKKVRIVLKMKIVIIITSLAVGYEAEVT